MKVVFISRKTIINIALVISITMVSVFYAMGGRLGFINVFLNTQNEIPIYSVETRDKKLALTFDAAWGDQYTDEILRILEKNNVKATFFLVGSWTDRYGDKVKKIKDMGHEIGNHSTTHPHFTQLDSQKIKEEIYATSNKVKNITGESTKLFRLPFGDYNSDVVRTVRETGHFCIQWDVDSLDWRGISDDEVYNRVVSKVSNGSIVLFHNSCANTAESLPHIIEKLRKDGYTFVTISDMLFKENYYVDSLGRQRSLK